MDLPTGPARRGRAALVALLLVVPLAVAAGTAPGAAAPATATLVDVRAAHHAGFDRVVLEFDTARPPSTTVSRVRSLIGDFSGLEVPVPGRSILRIVAQGAAAHTEDGEATVAVDRAFALPNAMVLRGAGDFEGVLTLGLGLARAMPFHVHRLSDPGRIAIDVSTRFARSTRTVYFVGSDARGQPVRRGVSRPIPDAAPATGLLDRLFAGPTQDELGRGLRLVTSGATGFRSVTVSDRVARVRLAGGCRAAGSTVTLADEVTPTLRRLPTVRWVKILSPSGQTAHPSGRRDSVPSCLSPATGTCLYLAQDVTSGPLHTGSFLVAHVLDGDLLGTTGAFYSEWVSVRGTVGQDATALEIQDEGGAWQPWPQVWLPASGTFEGWTPVSAADLRHWSGGGVPLAGQPCG
jgi:hypothetical protein